jgi:hypothetical protein
MSNPWVTFLKKHGGNGLTTSQLQKLYKKSKSITTTKSKSSKKLCRKRLSKKISVNMKEYKSGRWKNRKQALAVSYSQIRKKYPECVQLL